MSYSGGNSSREHSSSSYHSHHHSSNQHRRDSPSNRHARNHNHPARNSHENSYSSKTMPSVSQFAAHGENLTEGMAGLTLDNCRYAVGSMVAVKIKSRLSQQEQVVKGEVTGYDPAFKILTLKGNASKPGLSNATLINLSSVVEVKVVKEAKEQPAELPSINPQKLQQRLRDAVERKKKLIMAFKVGVSPEGQKLFQAICKTIDDVQWDGQNIVVMSEVTIEPPYTPENVRGEQESKALKHIRKIVQKHISDQQQLIQDPPKSEPEKEAVSSSSSSSVDSSPPTATATTTTTAAAATTTTSGSAGANKRTSTTAAASSRSTTTSSTSRSTTPSTTPTTTSSASSSSTTTNKESTRHTNDPPPPKPMYNQ